MRCFAARLVFGPRFRQVKPPIDQRLAETAGIGGKHANLTVFDPAGGSRILPRNPHRMLALLEEAGVIVRVSLNPGHRFR
jgi:hypothetical protein